MPSPFPGMDPFLEDAEGWAPFHMMFVARITAYLNRLLPMHYMASVGERVYVVDSDRSIYSDTGVFERTDVVQSTTSAMAIAVDAPLILIDRSAEVREYFVEIRAVRSDLRLITVIEVLSPSNKYAGPGRDLYLAKQEECLAGPVHLLEIDLLRRAPHTVAAPLIMIPSNAAAFDYIVSLHRARSGRRYEIWPFRLVQRMPRVIVPLATGDVEVPLDLQECFAQAYEEGAFDRRIRYREEVPPPHLTLADAAWADALLRERGLRS